jgi:hypothetical protein
MTEFLEDCPDVASKIENREYRYKDHEQIFAEYNQCNVQIFVSSPGLDAGNTTQNPSPAATGVVTGTTTAVTAPASNQPNSTESSGATKTALAEDSDTKKAKLSKIDAFRSYVRNLEDFNQARDVLEWLTDVEYRVIEDQGIPNYLWSSLEEMSKDHNGLKQKAEELKKDLL